MFEVILISLIISILTATVMLTMFKHKTHIIEAVCLIIISILFGMIFRYFSVTNLTKDQEYWGSKFVRVEYHEPWDEYIYKTCTRQYACGSDSNGNTTYCTESYDCSYVEQHSAKYIKYDHLDNTYFTSRDEYNRLKNKNSNSSYTDMHRDYHSYDGDMHYSVWDGDDKNYEMISSVHSYENKTQVSPTVFKYVEVDSLDISFYNLKEYPKVNGNNYQPCILGYKDLAAEHRLQVLNGDLGNSKQVRVFITIFKDKPLSASTYQQSYWKGGNKNEVLVTIGIDKDSNVKWSNVFSWSDKESFKIHIRDFINTQQKINISEIVEYTYKDIQANFERKEFSDFDYIEVSMTSNQYIGLFICNIILNIILSIIFIKNNF